MSTLRIPINTNSGLPLTASPTFRDLADYIHARLMAERSESSSRRPGSRVARAAVTSVTRTSSSFTPHCAPLHCPTPR